MSKNLIVSFVVLLISATWVFGVYSPEKEDPRKLQGIIDNLIKNMLEKVRNTLPDTLSINDTNVALNSSVIDGRLDLSNVEVSGLKYDVVEVKLLSLDTAFVNLNFKKLTLDLDEDTDLLLANLIPVYGSGPSTVILRDLNVNTTATVEINLFPPGIKRVKNVKVVMTVGAANFDLHGILDNEELSLLVSTVLNDFVVSLVNNHTQAISNITSKVVEDVINAAINKTKKLDDEIYWGEE